MVTELAGKKGLFCHLLLLACTVLFIGCSDSDNSYGGYRSVPSTGTDTGNDDTSITTSTAQLVGFVRVDEQAIADTSVSVNGIAATTDSQGFFQVSDIEIPENNRWIVGFSKPGYVTTQHIVELNPNQSRYSIEIQMTAPDMSVQVDLTQDQTVSLNQDQLTLMLPAGVVQGGGENATVSLTYGDPSSERGRDIFPGDYSATNSIEAAPNIILESIGFMDITVTDENGNDLTQLTSPADVSLRLPFIYQAGGEKSEQFGDGDTIEWWSYNETLGTWLREDADPTTVEVDNALVSNVNGVLYANAKVTHFSWWNVDRPIEEHACITVRVLDKDANPIGNQLVTAEGISYDSSDSALTDADGYVSLTVKRSEDPTRLETFRLFATVGSIEFEYDVTSVTEGGIDSDILNSPTEGGSTVFESSGSCTILENPLLAFYGGTVQGTVFSTQGVPAPDTTVYNSLGDSITTDENGSFTFSIPHNEQVFILIPGILTRFVETTEVQPTVILPIILGNQPPIINEIVFNPPSDLSPGQTVDITANVTDPDNDDLTVTWSASAGMLINTTGSTVQWVVPADSSGSADITVTVSDSAANEVSRLRVVNWASDTSNQDEFYIQAKQSYFTTDGAVEGLAVILHGVDGKSIEQVVSTNQEGIANFGLIDRERITVTVIEEYLENNKQNYTASTYVDVKNQPFSYWISGVDGKIYEPYICESDEKINFQATFVNIPLEVNSIFIVGQGDVMPDDGEPIDIALCPAYVDGDLYIVAHGYEIVETNDEHEINLISHSQAISATEVMGAIEFDMSATPITLPYINNTDAPVSVSVNSNSSLFLPMLASENRVDQTVSLFDIASDGYLFRASTEEENAGGDTPDEEVRVFYDLSWSSQTLPANLVIEKPVFTADNIVFDAAQKSYSWSLSNSAGVDATTIALTNESDSVTWEVVISPNRTSYTLPELPTEYSVIFNSEQLDQTSLEIIDYSDYQGLDSLIENLLHIDLDETSNEQFFFIESSNVRYQVSTP